MTGLIFDLFVKIEVSCFVVRKQFDVLKHCL